MTLTNQGIMQKLVEPPTGYVRPLNEVHTEYPKFVHFPDKPSVIVQDAEEENRVLAGGKPVEHALAETLSNPAPVPVLVGQNDEMAMLQKIAADKGVHLDGRWGIKKIRKVLEQASA